MKWSKENFEKNKILAKLSDTLPKENIKKWFSQNLQKKSPLFEINKLKMRVLWFHHNTFSRLKWVADLTHVTLETSSMHGSSIYISYGR